MCSPGPGGLFWDPGSFAGGGYSSSAAPSTCFPRATRMPPAPPGSTVPSGSFVAGRDLEAEAPAFVSFRIDNSRRFRITEHSGGGMRELIPWTASKAVAALAEDAEGTGQRTCSPWMCGTKPRSSASTTSGSPNCSTDGLRLDRRHRHPRRRRSQPPCHRDRHRDRTAATSSARCGPPRSGCGAPPEARKPIRRLKNRSRS